ncbi:MAG TPA: hypothetical protein VL588_00450, partial [Bdellovibrionota bacterium]|nr:hypothetical protein [Bdellovibrionota bacterium]
TDTYALQDGKLARERSEYQPSHARVYGFDAAYESDLAHFLDSREPYDCRDILHPQAQRPAQQQPAPDRQVSSADSDQSGATGEEVGAPTETPTAPAGR